MLSEAGIEVTDENEEKVEEVIHEFVGEKARYGRCSADWRKARKTIYADDALRGELVERLKVIAA